MLKQASPKPRRKLVMRAIGVLAFMKPDSAVLSSGASAGKLMNIKTYETRVRRQPNRRIGCLPHLIVRKPKKPKTRPPTTSPAATIIALIEASAVLLSPNLKRIVLVIS